MALALEIWIYAEVQDTDLKEFWDTESITRRAACGRSGRWLRKEVCRTLKSERKGKERTMAEVGASTQIREFSSTHATPKTA